MENEAENRRNILRAIVEKDGLTTVAMRVGKPASQINDMLAGRKAFGEKVARKMELTASLPKYYFEGIEATSTEYNQPRIAGSVIAEYSMELRDVGVPNFLKKSFQPGKVPLISWVQAGDFCDTEDPFQPGEAEDWLICPEKHSNQTYALEVNGPSMDSGDADGYPTGMHIFVDPQIEPKHGDDVVVRTPEGKATFKRLQISNEGSFLIALNPAWPDRIIKVPEGTVYCGVVIYSGKKRR